MPDDVPEYLPLVDPPSASTLDRSSRPATLPIKRLGSTDDNQGPRQRARTDSQNDREAERVRLEYIQQDGRLSGAFITEVVIFDIADHNMYTQLEF
ncbi:hypothetical protein FIBSPDRAFT_1048843 [Athelia psychrophila]|uniref:Uncharacterized protein n=1 Tax=Athelia psychrophila TaxID=1759441 RepID=A0A166D438_9AGAM|nr:hypothetical protein FIBSPDRAFT_1048843 [Fibularhizoctonia sp. CBS 109695]